MNAMQVKKTLKNHGWVLVRVKGSHHHFKHPSIRNLVTLPFHGSKDLTQNILNSISKMSGIPLR